MKKRAITRRQAVTSAGLLGAAYATGLGRNGVADLGGIDTAAGQDACVLSPAKTEGPYFVDEKLNRSDIRGGQAGVALTLELTILDADNACAPVPDAMVDLWHASAAGKYSDEASEGTSGQTWLRGFQTTGVTGKVTFTTIYPGWYSGRAVHLHLKVRRTVGGATLTYNTQFFFPDALNNAVEQSYGRGNPNVANGADGIYGSDGSSLLLNPTGSPSEGYTAAFTLNVSRSATETGTGGGPGGAPPGGTPPPRPTGGVTVSDGTTAPTTTTTTTTATNGATVTTPTPAADEVVDFALAAATFRRLASGRRQLRLTLRAKETVAFRAVLVRGSRTLVSKSVAKMAPGTRTLKVSLPAGVAGGTARLQLVVVDALGNVKRYDRRAVVPKRSG